MNSENGYGRIHSPKDLDEAISELLRIVPAEDLEKFKDTPENRISGKVHFGIGMWMRGKWRLWVSPNYANFSKRKESIMAMIYQA